MTDLSDRESPSSPAGRPPDWRWMLVLGVVMVLGGLVALANPFVASLTAVAVAGAAFLLGGVVQIWIALSSSHETAAERAVNIVLGAALVLLAVLLLIDPLSGLVTLTVAVAVMLIVFGVLRTMLAWRMRPRAGWGQLMASGVLSVLLGLFILATLPAAAGGVLGILLAVDLLVSGAVSIAAAIRLRRGG